MHLLVSVRSAAEALDAVAGGADIVDAKEPSNGALGAVAPGVLQAIAAAIPGTTPLSAALGEGDAHTLASAIATLPRLDGRHGWYAKFALHGGPDVAAIERATRQLAARPDAPRLIVARYADAGLDDMPAWLAAAARGGAWGVLLDTAQKDGRTLLQVASGPVLHNFARQAQNLGLVLALAGGLGEPALEALVSLGVQVMGVRGAVCDAGREGRLRRERVARLRECLALATRPRAAGALPA